MDKPSDDFLTDFLKGFSAKSRPTDKLKDSLRELEAIREKIQSKK